MKLYDNSGPLWIHTTGEKRKVSLTFSKKKLLLKAINNPILNWEHLNPLETVTRSNCLIMPLLTKESIFNITTWGGEDKKISTLSLPRKLEECHLDGAKGHFLRQLSPPGCLHDLLRVRIPRSLDGQMATRPRRLKLRETRTILENSFREQCFADSLGNVINEVHALPFIRL